MNVYKLADALEKIETYNQVIHRSFNDKTKLTASADMLREQADRIAELEKEKIRAYDNGFEDGQKSKTPKTYVLDGKQVFDTTPQIKELSDEEIEQIAIKWYVGSRILPIGFARAILKKASEK